MGETPVFLAKLEMNDNTAGSNNQVHSSSKEFRPASVPDDIVILSPIPPSRYEEVADRATPFFVQEETLALCFSSRASGDHAAAFRETALFCLRSGLCAAALSPAGEVVGACLSHDLPRDEVVGVDVHTLGEEDGASQEKHILRFLTFAHQRVDLFSAFDVTEILDMALLYVEPSHRGRGIAKRLLQASATLAARRGFVVAKGDATSVTSAAVFQKAGFTQVYSMPFADYKSNGEVIFANATPPNDKLRIFVARLRPEEPCIFPPTGLKLDIQ